MYSQSLLALSNGPFSLPNFSVLQLDVDDDGNECSQLVIPFGLIWFPIIQLATPYTNRFVFSLYFQVCIVTRSIYPHTEVISPQPVRNGIWFLIFIAVFTSPLASNVKWCNPIGSILPEWSKWATTWYSQQLLQVQKFGICQEHVEVVYVPMPLYRDVCVLHRWRSYAYCAKKRVQEHHRRSVIYLRCPSVR